MLSPCLPRAVWRVFSWLGVVHVSRWGAQSLCILPGAAGVWGQPPQVVSPSRAALRPKPRVSRVNGQGGLQQMVPPSQHASRKSGRQSLAFLEERWRGGPQFLQWGPCYCLPLSQQWFSQTGFCTLTCACTHTCTHTHNRPHAHTALRMQLCILAKDFLYTRARLPIALW